MSTSAAVATDLGLVDCAANDLAQRFSYAHELGTISPDALPAQCITAGATSRSAGPFMSRDLLLADCAETPSELTRWIIVN